MNTTNYIPAISVGALVTYFKQNEKINGKSMRFYQQNPDNVFNYPYLLISAGHNYTKDTKTDFGYNFTDGKEKIILGDSGGFQIATGAIKYTQEIVEQIFKWLENNSNFAINLDLPPSLAFQANNKEKFNDYLNKTVHNMQFFEKNQSGKTKYLNVLHGRDIDQLNEWYNKVKDFQFTGGWSFGSSAARSVFTALFSFFYIYTKGEFQRLSKLPGKKLIHFLGVSAMEIIPILIYLQKKLNDMQLDAKITFDSSSPFMQANYGKYMMRKRSVLISNKLVHNEQWNKEVKLPCICPVCQGLRWKDILNLKKVDKASFDCRFYTIISLHNLYSLISQEYEMKNVINLNCPEITESYFSNIILTAFKIIDKIFESDNPLAVLYEHQNYFRKFDNEPENENLEDLFS